MYNNTRYNIYYIYMFFIYICMTLRFSPLGFMCHPFNNKTSALWTLFSFRRVAGFLESSPEVSTVYTTVSSS